MAIERQSQRRPPNRWQPPPPGRRRGRRNEESLFSRLKGSISMQHRKATPSRIRPRRSSSMGDGAELHQQHQQSGRSSLFGGGGGGGGQRQQRSNSNTSPPNNNNNNNMLQIMYVNNNDNNSKQLVVTTRSITSKSTAASSSSYSQYDTSMHPFQIPRNTVLQSRGSYTYCYLFLFTVVATISVGDMSSVRSSAAERGSIALLSICTILTFGIAVAYRYRPLREYITYECNINIESWSIILCCCLDDIQRGRSRSGGYHCYYYTIEGVLSSILLLLYVISSGIILNPTNGLAISSNNEIWNTNLFFSMWSSLCLACYIMADLITASGIVSSDGGVLPREVREVMAVNAVERGWMMLFFATISLLASSTSTMGLTFGILGMIYCSIYYIVCLWERRRFDSFMFHSRRRSGHHQVLLPPKSYKNIISSVLSGIATICYIINVAFVTFTRHQEYGMTSHPANVYVSSWLCLGISVYLCIQHGTMYLVPSSQRRIILPPSSSCGSSAKIRKGGGLVRSSSKSTVTSASSGPSMRMDADDALMSMVQSQDEDGPMLFLPQATNGNSYHDIYHRTSSNDEDASYESVPYQQQQQQQQRNSGPRPPPPPRPQVDPEPEESITRTTRPKALQPAPPLPPPPTPPPPRDHRRQSIEEYSVGTRSVSTGPQSIGPRSAASSKSPRSYQSRGSGNDSRKSNRSRGYNSRTSSKSPSSSYVRKQSGFTSNSSYRSGSVHSNRSGVPSTVSGNNSRGPSTVSSPRSYDGMSGPSTVSGNGGPRTQGEENDYEEEQQQFHTLDDNQPFMPTITRPRYVPPPPPQPSHQQPVIQEEDPSYVGFDTRPFKSIYNSSFENVSMVSDISHPSADHLDKQFEQEQNRNGAAPPPRTMKQGGETMRWSHRDLNPKSPNSSDEHLTENKAVRQGAVDKMVMEALRQAQEAQTGSQPSLRPTPPPRYHPSASTKNNVRTKANDGSRDAQSSNVNSYYSSQQQSEMTRSVDGDDEFDC